MRAKDVMTPEVVSVLPENGVGHIAQLMLSHGISAVPVIDEKQRLVGIVSEGDLLQRPEIGAPRRGAWWLGLFESPEARAVDYLKSRGLLAKDVMTEGVVTVEEDTPISGIAALLEDHQIKRVPVVREGRVVGIVSRADLLTAVAGGRPDQSATGDEAIKLAVAARIREDAGLPDNRVTVTVSDGTVHLWGDLQSDIERRAACTAAETVRGVRGVVSHLWA